VKDVGSRVLTGMALGGLTGGAIAVATAASAAGISIVVTGTASDGVAVGAAGGAICDSIDSKTNNSNSDDQESGNSCTGGSPKSNNREFKFVSSFIEKNIREADTNSKGINPVPLTGRESKELTTSRNEESELRTRNPAMERQIGTIKSHWNDILEVSAANRINPTHLAGIIIRESNAGETLDKNGMGDNGNAFGVAQVDKRFHNPCGMEKKDPWSKEHLNQSAAILKSNLDQVRKKHPKWSEKDVERGAIVAYNSGVGNVRTIDGMDKGTTHNDYSAKVLEYSDF
jgi:hypothetical protein